MMKNTRMARRIVQRYTLASPVVVNVRAWLTALKDVTGSTWRAIQRNVGPSPHQPGFIGATQIDFSSLAGNLNLSIWKHESGTMHPVLWWKVKIPGAERVEGSHVPIPLERRPVDPRYLSDPYVLTPFIKDPTFKKLFQDRPTKQPPRKDLAEIIAAYFKPRIWGFALNKATGRKWKVQAQSVPPKNPNDRILLYTFRAGGDLLGVKVTMTPGNPAFATVRFSWKVGKQRGSEEINVPLDALVGPSRTRTFFSNTSYLRDLFQESLADKLAETILWRQATTNPSDKIRNFFGVRNWLIALRRITNQEWKFKERKLRSLLGHGLYMEFEDGSNNTLKITLYYSPRREKLVSIHRIDWDILGESGYFVPSDNRNVPPKALAGPDRLIPYIPDQTFKMLFGKPNTLRQWQKDLEDNLFVPGLTK